MRDPAAELTIFYRHLASSLLACGAVWVFYVALEPYIRRLWPRTLVSWIRLLDGRWRDPLIGHHVLAGCSFGLAIVLLMRLDQLIPEWIGWPPPGPQVWGRLPISDSYFELISLSGVQTGLWTLLTLPQLVLVNNLSGVVGLLLLRLLLRRTWLAVLTLLIFVTVMFAPQGGELYTQLLVSASIGILWLFVWFRYGFLASGIGLFVSGLLRGYPLTPDLTAWYAPATMLSLGVFLAMVVYGFYVSLAGRPLFRDEIFPAGPSPG